jgi:hypothetical protein
MTFSMFFCFLCGSGIVEDEANRFCSGGVAVNSGGIAVSSAQIEEVTRLVREVRHLSGRSRIRFEEKLKRRLGPVDGGKKFMASLSDRALLVPTTCFYR